MAYKSAVPALVQSVKDYFESQGITAQVEFGRKKLAQQINQGEGGANSVVFAPDPEGRAGKILDARLNATKGTSRPIKTWEKYLVIQIWAADDTDVENELAQWEAFETLFEVTMQAVARFCQADVTWGDPQWIEPTTERFFGYAALISISYRGPLFAPPEQTYTPQPQVNRDPQ